MRTATPLSDVQHSTVYMSGADREFQHFKLDPPLHPDYGDAVEYVIVSAVSTAFDTGRAETLVFEADASGQVVDWMDLARADGVMDIPQALANAGYDVVEVAA
jgi:hypothetical protein